MTVGVGIIILLFEASQAELRREMERLVESDSQVKEMGIRDRLTGLYNRHYFNDVIRRELARSRRHGVAISVLLIDVDRFKEINDVRGHQIGDEVLQFVANYLTACVREIGPRLPVGRRRVPRPADPGRRGLGRAEGRGARPRTSRTSRAPSTCSRRSRSDGPPIGPRPSFPRTLAEADARMYEMKLSRKKEREARERDPRRP